MFISQKKNTSIEEKLISGNEAISGGIFALIAAAIGACIALIIKLCGGSSDGSSKSSGTSKAVVKLKTVTELAFGIKGKSIIDEFKEKIIDDGKIYIKSESLDILYKCVLDIITIQENLIKNIQSVSAIVGTTEREMENFVKKNINDPLLMLTGVGLNNYLTENILFINIQFSNIKQTIKNDGTFVNFENFVNILNIKHFGPSQWTCTKEIFKDYIFALASEVGQVSILENQMERYYQNRKELFLVAKTLTTLKKAIEKKTSERIRDSIKRKNADLLKKSITNILHMEKFIKGTDNFGNMINKLIPNFIIAEIKKLNKQK